ncbi:MAG: hypothetical protein WB800_24750, partial [Streptosporangiaceae bacterium]
MVNNVIGVVNYVIAARPSLLNFVIADTTPPTARLPPHCSRAPNKKGRDQIRASRWVQMRLIQPEA